MLPSQVLEAIDRGEYVEEYELVNYVRAWQEYNSYRPSENDEDTIISPYF